MPFVGTQQLPGESIIVTTYDGQIDADTVRDGSMKVAELMASIPGKVYAVVDLSTITTSLGDVLKIMTAQSQGTEGTTTDPKLAAMVVVGSDKMVRLYTDAMRKRVDSVKLPMYRSVEAGIDALRLMIADANAKHPE